MMINLLIINFQQNYLSQQLIFGMNQESIRKILKKYDVDFKGRKYLQKQLINKKIQTKLIRNYLCHQGDKVSTIFCLIKGSVEIFHTSKNQIKQRIVEDDEQKDSSRYKIPKLKKQKLSFCTVEGEFQMINEQLLIDFLQNQEKRSIKKVKQKNNDKSIDLSDNLCNVSQSQNNQIINSQGNNKIQIKCRYSAIVNSSQCDYIELTFNEAKALLKDQIQSIKGKQKERQKIIKESRQLSKLKRQQNFNQKRIQQIAMINIQNKTHSQHIENKSDSQSVDNLKKPKSISLLNTNRTERKLNKRDQSLPLLNNFKNQLQLYNQNQLILQRYRSRKAFQKFNPSHQSHHQKAQNHFEPISKTETLIEPINKNQDKLFKQNLKKIIKKKLNFQKKYGETIKQFAYATKLPSEQKVQKDKVQIRHDNIRTSFQKSYSMDKLKMIKLQNHNNTKLNGPKLNTFGLSQERVQTDKLKHKFLHHIQSKTTRTPSKIDNMKTSLNGRFQKPIQEYVEIQKMRKRLQQQLLFLRLQNLDNYFDKVD